MMFSMVPADKHLDDGMNFENIQYWRDLPIIQWLETHVGKLSADGKCGSEWTIGCCHEHDYLFKPGHWRQRHYIQITADIDEKLLTEFALRFS